MTAKTVIVTLMLTAWLGSIRVAQAQGWLPDPYWGGPPVYQRPAPVSLGWPWGAGWRRPVYPANYGGGQCGPRGCPPNRGWRDGGCPSGTCNPYTPQVGGGQVRRGGPQFAPRETDFQGVQPTPFTEVAPPSASSAGPDGPIPPGRDLDRQPGWNAWTTRAPELKNYRLKLFGQEATDNGPFYP